MKYCNDHGSSNQCGDVVLMQDNKVGTATVWVPLLVDVDIPCVDDNLDGTLDLSMCLTWRTDEMDVACAIDGDLTTGLYPSSGSACHCETYEVPTIKVVTVQDDVAHCH